MRVPIGVIGIVYESRSERHGGFCRALFEIRKRRASGRKRGDPFEYGDCVGPIGGGGQKPVSRPGRSSCPRDPSVSWFLFCEQDRFIDLIIPRGGESLMRVVTEHATIPVCHNMMLGVVTSMSMSTPTQRWRSGFCFNAKVQRPSTCNAMETLLVHQGIARHWLAPFIEKLAAANVEVRGCQKTCQLSSSAKPASDDDFGKEFLDLTVAVKVVKHVDEAMEHIAKYGSRHTEAIVTSDYPKAMRFLREVDASAVLVNASTRFERWLSVRAWSRNRDQHVPHPCPSPDGAGRIDLLQVYRHWGAGKSASKQAAETGPQLRSQSFEPLNVPNVYASGFSLLAASLADLFEQPAAYIEIISCESLSARQPR